MRPLSAAALLEVWERGRVLSPAQRALALLSAASDSLVQELAELPVGRRDELLLTAREWAFGPDLACITACPACEERIETTMSCAQMRAGEPERRETVEVEGYVICFRPPSTADLEAVESAAAGDTARLLLARCSDLPEDAPCSVADAVILQMKAADPQAHVEAMLVCPSCGHRWSALFDILSFFWREIEVWARRTVQQIHLLASAYGWTESEILSLSAARRRTYVEMVSA